MTNWRFRINIWLSQLNKLSSIWHQGYRPARRLRSKNSFYLWWRPLSPPRQLSSPVLLFQFEQKQQLLWEIIWTGVGFWCQKCRYTVQRSVIQSCACLTFKVALIVNCFHFRFQIIQVQSEPTRSSRFPLHFVIWRQFHDKKVKLTIVSSYSFHSTKQEWFICLHPSIIMAQEIQHNRPISHKLNSHSTLH